MPSPVYRVKYDDRMYRVLRMSSDGIVIQYGENKPVTVSESEVEFVGDRPDIDLYSYGGDT